MIPYIKYLYALFLQYNDDFDKIIEELKNYGLPSKESVLETAYDRFLNSLSDYSNNFVNCLFMEFSDSEFEKYAQILGVDSFFIDRMERPTVSEIAEDSLIRKHVECSLIASVEHGLIVEDVKSLYKKEITEEDIMMFRTIFFDTSEIVKTNNFVKYVEMLSPDERALKNKCRANGADYTRWALGVDIHMDAKKITKNLMTDAYFRYKETSTEKDIESFDKSIKLGALVTKLIDREVKLDGQTPPDDDSLQEAYGKQLSLFETADDNARDVSSLKEDDPVPKMDDEPMDGEQVELELGEEKDDKPKD